MGLSFGRIGLAVAGGLAEGASEAIDKRQERADKEIARRDALFQQAMRYADQDRDKYNAVLKDKQEMLALAREQVSAMGLADDEQSQLVVAAGLVKQSRTKETLEKRLAELQRQYTVDPDTVKKGFAPLTSKLDQEVLRSVTFDSLTEQLVSPSQRLKGLGSYYQPTPFESEGIFKRVGQKDIARQEAQFKQTAEAFGLGKREVGDVPSLSGPIPYSTDIPQAMSASERRALAAAQRQAGNIKDAEQNEAAADKMEKDAADARRNLEGRTVSSVEQLSRAISAATADPSSYHAIDTAMSDVLSLEVQRQKGSVSADTKRSTSYQAIYTAFANAKMEGINTKEQLQNLQFAQNSFQNVENNPALNTAFAYRNGSTENLTDYLNTLKNMDTKSEKFNALPEDVQNLAGYLKAPDVEKRINTKPTLFKQLLDPLLKNGYFVPESQLRAYNPLVVYQSAFAKAPSTAGSGNPPTDQLPKQKPKLSLKQQKEIEKEIDSFKRQISRLPKWMNRRQQKEEQLKQLEEQLK